MATNRRTKQVSSKSRFVNGISDFQKEGPQDSYYFGRAINHRSDPRSVTLNNKSAKESGSVIEDLPKWGEIIGTNTYAYGDNGKIYLRTSEGVWSKLHQAPNSHGNGLSYFGEDDFMYYTNDTTIGRYGPISINPQFNDDFLGSQGGVPLNTNSLWLQSASSMYASRADTASLSITDDLSIEAQVYQFSLPTTGNSMTFVSKWNENGNLRSYKFDMTTQSNYFGDGSDGTLTISVNTTDTPIDSACTGSIGSTALLATNASFAAGQIVLVIQMTDSSTTTAGTWQRNKISSYTAGTITLDQSLNASYGSKAQVLVLKQYTTVTVNTGITWTAKSWDGTVGGILSFLANTSFTNNSNSIVSANGNAASGGTGGVGCGFKGGDAVTGAGSTPYQGDGTGGTGARSHAANGNGGGGGLNETGLNGESAPGGPGGNGTSVASFGSWQNGSGYSLGINSNSAIPGTVSGSSDLTTMTLGGGGGAGSGVIAGLGYAGGAGGGIIFISAATITNSGSIAAVGGDGAWFRSGSHGAGGAGGSILLKCQTATLGTLITNARGANGPGSNGGAGRITVNYLTTYTGTSIPTLTAIQDPTLGAADGYVLRLQVSSNGTAVTTFTKPIIPSLQQWKHIAVSWDAQTLSDATKSQAEFFYNGASLGTITSSTTSISDNASEFFVGAYKNGSGTATGFYDGYIDEVRVWQANKSQEEYALGMQSQILTTLPYLKAYYKFNGALTDATTNANNLTGTNSPTYVTNVPFASPTTRLDIDQSATTTGNTYTLGTTINEGSTHRKTFTPAKDPQKSLAVLVAAVGTGTWTLTVHDQYNNLIAQESASSTLTTSVVDSYSETNKDDNVVLGTIGEDAYSQAFKSSSTQTLYSVKFYLSQKRRTFPEPILTPTGTLKVRIYQHSGTYGVDGTPELPTTTYLAESDIVQANVISTSYALQEFVFTGPNRIKLQRNTYYCAVIMYTSNPTDSIIVGINVGTDSSSPTHLGNPAYLGFLSAPVSGQKSFSLLDHWYSDTDYDICFYVYSSEMSSLAVGYTEFIFDDPWRPLINANYHFHLTSTVADGTVTTTSADDLETVSYRTYFQFLVTDTKWHPVAKMLQFLVFGNERYVGTYEATLYNPNTLTLRSGDRVRCFAYYKEYLAIGTVRGDDITSQDAGRIYFWDGIASTYNFFVDVPEGGINAMLGAKGKLFVWAGYQGDLLIYQGGDSTEQIKRVPLVENDKYIEVYPGAVNMWRMLVRFGVAGAGDSTDVQRGTYTWGSQNVRYQDSLSFDYPLSTGTLTSDAKIGLVMVVNNKLLVGFQDNVSYGVDMISADNDPYETGEIQMLLEDDGEIWKEKEVLQIVANFEPLNEGESVDIKYKLDRSSTWNYLGAVTTEGETVARLVILENGSRYHEIQYGADLATTTTTSPKLLGLSIERDLLLSEERVG